MTAQTKVLFDLTVLVDALIGEAAKQPASISALQLVTNGKVDGYLCATAIDSLNDILSRSHGWLSARSQLIDLRGTLNIAPVDAAVVDAAMALEWEYLDDALTHECARVNGLDRLVTLNPIDFINPSIPVLAPEEFLKEVQTTRV
ncbi:PilT domain-containing protein [Thiorhodococcus drewsii AZ1]|uniref:PilT domain-containing protein n=1 Tax=Thiorhodococcus drewsii AZ1 TaxID=765913 RepID=G2DY12_9GAMM|nr:PIN domain-containing protein [Thiorhodococcus drewsii]EGV32804.1 PilT domain-containing protein [Thiorhodococcus drewsii AZ1]